ncbi:hypothetical protein DCE94_06950 [Agromyces badenianii]|nr:hypothetical protein DCE94_06950 [Agromyces badenianii]
MKRCSARTTGAGIIAVLLASMLVIAVPAEPAAAAEPAPNPSIPAQCGLGVTLVLDASGSVQQSNAVGAVRTAAESFLTAFSDTGSTARVLQFASLSEQLAPRATVDAASLAPNGAFREAIDGYYNPIPQRPASVAIKSFNSGNPANAGSWSSANSSTQYTNWDQSFSQASTDAGDLVVYVTDGDPTAYDFDRAGDPFDPGPPPDVGVGTNRNSTVLGVTMDRAVESANAAKAAGARVLALGVGAALQNSDSQQRLTQIAGPNIARSMAEFDIETTDVALVSDFDDLAQAVRELVLDLCSPSLTIRKLAQSASDGSYQPAEGWDMTVEPTVPGGFGWVLPTGAAGPTATVTTSRAGFASFQWEPIDEDALSGARVTEDLHADFTPGRPGAGNDFRCEFKNADGEVRVVTGELAADAQDSASFELTGIGNEIGTCSVYNSFDYAPDILITKVNSPATLRGDLVPLATVRSDYVVTNPGNTPLADVAVTDDKCGPGVPVVAGTPPVNVGDSNADLRLDTTESWQHFCERPARASNALTAPVNIVNTAEAQGRDPAGTVVTGTATDDVDVYIPALGLEAREWRGRRHGPLGQ